MANANATVTATTLRLNCLELQGYILVLVEDDGSNLFLGASRHTAARNAVIDVDNPCWQPMVDTVIQWDPETLRPGQTPLFEYQMTVFLQVQCLVVL